MSETLFPQANQHQTFFSELNYTLTAMLQEWNVPGLALAVVKDDELLLAQGYGVRQAGEQKPVTGHTIFAVASTTKPFTAASVGLLVDEGKVRWGDRVVSHLPDFQLYDPYVTQHLTVRDLLCARAGLVGGDFMHLGNGLDREEVVRRLRYLKPGTGFRTVQGSYTLMYAVAGQLVGVVSGQRWDELLCERLLSPLGMSASATSMGALQRAENVATPHFLYEDRLCSTPWTGGTHPLDNVGPAGSLSSTVVDLAQWVCLHLNEGIFRQQRLISRAVMQEMHTPQIIDASPLAKSINPDAHVVTYGLGWYLHDYRGRKVIECAGALLEGMCSLIAMIPEERLGIIVLANADQARYLVRAVKFLLFDHFLNAPARDWNAYYLNEWRQMRAFQQNRLAQTRTELAARRVAGTHSSHPLEHYTGTYTDDYYGEITVILDGEQLALCYGLLLYARLEHWHYDTFKTSWRPPFFGEDLVTFTFTKWGTIKSMDVSDFANFTRVE